VPLCHCATTFCDQPTRTVSTTNANHTTIMSLKLVKAHLKQFQTTTKKKSQSKKRKMNPNRSKKTDKNKRRIVGTQAARTEGKRRTLEIINEIEREQEDRRETTRKNVKTIRALASRKGDIAAATLEKLLERRRR
jgi:hypothetical protein